MRVAYVLAVISICLVPIHSVSSGEVSGAVCLQGCVLAVAVLGLSVSAPVVTPHRFLPAVIGLFALVAHTVFTH